MLLSMSNVLYLGIIIIITAISELSVCELFPPLLTISVPSIFTVKQSRKKGNFETSAATRPLDGVKSFPLATALQLLPINCAVRQTAGTLNLLQVTVP